jgi:diguanylate cyclase (GGDEF)-like protein
MEPKENREKAGSASEPASRNAEYLARLRKLQKREWWLWGCSLFVILALTAGVASLSLPAIIEERNSPVGHGVLEAVSGLVLLILVFGCYLTYDKYLINKLRLELAEKQFHSTLWRDLALVDQLTGLYNRRFAERRLREEISRCHRQGFALTVVLIDLDGFKQVNDRHGHAAGDQVLKIFAEHLGKAVRDEDLAARLGGDEFMLLLSECTSSQVPVLLKRLEAIEIEWAGEKISISFSVGWKEYELGEQPERMLQVADEALYQHKQSRKNAQVISIPE